MVFVPMAQAPPKADAKELSYNSLNLIHEFTSLFSLKVIVAGLPSERFPTEALQKHAFVDISVFLKATNFTQTPKKNKHEFWNCHLAMLGRVAKPIFTSLCPGQPLRI